MNERREKKRKKGRATVVAAWTVEQAQRALPYLTSIIRSLRELHLELRNTEARLQRLEARPGRPDRHILIEQQDLKKELDRLRGEFETTLTELEDLNVSSVEPGTGLAMIPIIHDEQLAWLVFELFEDARINSWRYHSDSLDRRRPLRDLRDGTPASTIV